MSLKEDIPQNRSHGAPDSQHVDGQHFGLYRDPSDACQVHPPCTVSHSDQSQGDDAKLSQRYLSEAGNFENGTSNVLVTVLMPCLNEARTLAACIQQAHAGCQAALVARNVNHHALEASSGAASLQPKDDQSTTTSSHEYTYEILIADNGSTDDSPVIAAANGARVAHVEQKGYGAALRGGIASAQGKYIVMGDSDCSYDFGEVSRFLNKLKEGFDLVMGNRFAGGIMAGAMPLHYRYIGNPILSAIGCLLYGTRCRDWHCGLRAFDRSKIGDLDLRSRGMEYASELIVKATNANWRISEIPVVLNPDGRGRPPHLRSVRDGCRHLTLLLRHRISSFWVGLLHCINLVALLLASAFGLFWAMWPASDFEIFPRLAPPSVSLSPSDSVEDTFVGVLILRNTLGGQVVNLSLHPCCKCTVLDSAPGTLGKGCEIQLSVSVAGWKQDENLLLVDYELLRASEKVPVSELVVLKHATRKGL